jgi:hypothetical protein
LTFLHILKVNQLSTFIIQHSLTKFFDVDAWISPQVKCKFVLFIFDISVNLFLNQELDQEQVIFFTSQVQQCLALMIGSIDVTDIFG